MSKKSLTTIDNAAKIYVNRSLNFGNIKLLGFDMDHTLAQYKKEEFEAIAFRSALEKLVDHGYPEELLQLEYKINSMIRGLLIDKFNGNILKVDGHKYVKDAYHGYRRLNKEERDRFYNKRQFRIHEYNSIDTLFSLSEAHLFVELVQYTEEHPGRIQKSYAEIHKDLRKFIDLSHRDGSIKNQVLREPERFINRDPDLGLTLLRLLDSGKQIFLLTNSQFPYTDKIMGYLLDDIHSDFKSWQDYWDYIIVGANKPGFFIGSQEFFEVIQESHLLKILDSGLRKGRIYYAGNAALFERLSGFAGDEILYIGDHIYGDIIRSKDDFNWRTMLVVEELADEIMTFSKVQSYSKKINILLAKREYLDEKIQQVKSSRAAFMRRHRGEDLIQQKHMDKYLQESHDLQGKVKHLDEQIKSLLEQRSMEFHPVWGELMKVGLELSRFAKQLFIYACLYTSKVSNLQYYSPQKKFTSSHNVLPHEVK